MRTARLPIHLGVDALWRHAGVAACLLPGCTLVLTGWAQRASGGGVAALAIGGALLLSTPWLAWLAWRARPSDARLDASGMSIDGGPHSGLFVRWDEMARAEVRWLDSTNTTSALALSLRDGQTLTLAVAADPAEVASLHSLAETIRVRLGEAATPPPERADLVSCRGCGAPLVPSDHESIRCSACGADNTLPSSLRERVAAQRVADTTNRSTATAVERLLDQPGVRGTRAALWVATLAAVAAWCLVLVSFRAAGISALDWFLIGSGFFNGWAITFGAFAFARIALARRRALLLLSTTFGARPPTRAGEGPGCRQCGAPLPTGSGAVASCAYCGAQSVLGLDVRPLLERVRGHRTSIEGVLSEQRAERSTWLKLALSASAVALLGAGWLVVQVSVTREFAEDVRRCEADDVEACSKVALAYFNGSAVKQDRAEAYRFNDLACERGHAESCAAQASALRFGWGVTSDLERARKKYERACELGSTKACTDLEDLD
ncbi:MAG: sel1 repeat family protein [Myxococcales bacterium]|nr:sel1 repeat family protein [Myxococcales bacterium]